MQAFCRQRIPESICVRKETIGIGILKISTNGDRKIMQTIRIMSGPAMRIPTVLYIHFCSLSSKI